MTPPPFNARTRVHEYGGGAWTVRDGTVYFSNFADGRLYRLAPDASEPQALTPAPPARTGSWRFADGVIDHRRNRWIGVREDHTAEGEPVNTIVAVDLGRPAASEPGRMLASGHDFYCSPRLSPDGNWLVWLAWDHPNMPWNGTMLYLAAIGADGALGRAATDRGRRDRIDLPAGMVARRRAARVRVRSLRLVESLRLRARDAGHPRRWRRWRRSSACRNGCSACRPMRSPGPIGSSAPTTQAGLGRLAVLDLARGTLTPLDTPFTEFGSVRADGDRVVFRAGAPDHPGQHRGARSCAPAGTPC